MRNPFLRLIIGLFLVIILPATAGFFLYYLTQKNIEIVPANKTFLQVPESKYKAENNTAITGGALLINKDIDPQKPLSDPPSIIKAVYLTSWSAGTDKKISYVINLSKTAGVNAVVVDVKDFSGFVAYRSGIEEVKNYGAEEVRIPKFNLMIKKFHDAGIYVIGRITVFQDPVVSRARPDWAIHSSSTLAKFSTLSANTLWFDRKGLSWIDPAAKGFWDYIVKFSKDLVERGIDELNYDYVRFPSDGQMEDMFYSHWDGRTPRHLIIKDFFRYLRSNLPDIKISADLFGDSTLTFDDLGIGQIIEDAFDNFDFVAPMVYPSHYASGRLGFPNPALHPYEIVKNSMDSAISRLKNWQLANSNSTSSPITGSVPKLRPWLQDFNLGANYSEQMVKLEIQAVKDALGENYNGFMLWNPSNIYSGGALHGD